MAASGARHGVAAGGSAGADHKLDGDELRRLVGIVADEAAGAVPVIAGNSVDSGRAAVRRAMAVDFLAGAAVPARAAAE